MASSAVAQDGTWKDRAGTPVPQTDARRTVDGLAGHILVTSDADWRAKWNTPSTTAPHFNEVKSVAKGKEVFVLIFFGNPKVDAGNRADVRCDIDVIGPAGETLVHQTDLVCYQGAVQGGPYNVYLAKPSIALKGTATDPAGTFTVRVALKDHFRKTVLPLKTTFFLQ